jgi:hypothetical protein
MKRLPEKGEGFRMALIVVAEAIHSGMTGNFNFYPRAELERAVTTWTEPYNKPVLTHHNLDSEPVGRVVGARFRKSSLKMNSYCAELTLNITDPDAQKKIEDGRYHTLSIGTTITSAVCSICKNDWAQGTPCEHRKGRVYDGKLCYWIAKIGEHVEVSFVNYPADPYAQIIDIKTAEEKTQESMDAVKLSDAGSICNRRNGEVAMEKMELIEEIVEAFEEPVENKEESTEVVQANEETQDAVGELKGQIEELKQQLEAVKAAVEESQGKLTAVVEQSVELARILREELVHHYADLAVASGLCGTADEAEQKAAEMSAKELRGEILKLSAKLHTEPRQTESVQCPGGEGVVEEKAAAQDENKYTIKDLEAALLKLLSSR